MAKIEFAVNDEWGVDRFSSVAEAVDHYEQTFREVQMEERLGFRYHFLVEHQGASVGQCQSPVVYLGALARRTSTIRLGAMVFPLPLYNPIRLAQDVAMIDQLSRGRLEFAVGIGTREHEFTRWSLPFDQRRAMTIEALEIIKKAWTEESVTYEGNYWSFDEAIPLPRPYQKPHPPIWYTGNSAHSLGYAATHNYNAGVALEPDPIIAEELKLWRQLWKEAGHPGPMPRSLLSRAVYVAETDEQAREEAAPYLVQSYTYGEKRVRTTRVKAVRGDATPDRQRRFQMYQDMPTSIDYWIEHGLAHVGSPETVIRRLEQQQQLAGFNVFVGSFRWGGLPNKLVEKSIRLFGQEVIPAFS